MPVTPGLIWLGIQAWRHRGTLAAAFAETSAVRSDRRALREGFVVGVTNPKALILFGAVLPRFVNRAAGDVPVQVIGVGVTVALTGRSS